jgi:hypothetical protein
VAAGLREVAVFHSPAAQLRPHQADLPFPVVADPGRELYAAFGVETSIRAVLHPRPLSTPLNPRSWAVVASSTDDGDRPSHTLATSSQARSISRSYVRF